MKRFRFRLERVRRVRRVLEQQARQALAGAIADRVAAEAAVDALRDEGRHHLAEMAVLQRADEVDVRRVLGHQARLVDLARAVELALEDVEEAEAYEDECVRDLADARRELEVVENLREKALLAHREDEQRAALAELDEHVARRHAVAARTAEEIDR